MASISLRGVAKSYGDVLAVGGIDVEAGDGEFLVLVGPSGSGKTTTLRLVAGLETLDDGQIFIGDRDVSNLAPGKRDSAMVFQSYALFPHLTVFENIAFGLRARKQKGEAVTNAVRQTAAALNIEGLLDRKPRQLSGGERQRVALGRAIVRHPAVFLMDEPLSNLDARLRVQTRAEIQRLQSQLGVTTMYVTHDQAEALALGHRIAILDAGAVQQIGTPQQVYQHPANAFVAGFIGSPPMNLIPVSRRDDGVAWEGGWAWLDAPVESGLLGIRPEHVRLSGPESDHAIDAVVTAIESTGDQVIVVMQAGSASIAARAEPSFQARAGDRIRIWFDEAHLYLFDEQGNPV